MLHENAVLDVTETIVVDFSSPSHGIYRALQTSLVQEKATGGETVQMPYKARVTDVQVDGVPFETFTEDGVFFIRIGDEDETVAGTQVYTLRYSYDFGADRVPEYDEFTYSPIGANWEVPIQKASWRVQFEKPLPESAVAAFTAQAQQAVSVTVSQDAASFVCGQPIQPGQDIVLSTMLPEGYFYRRPPGAVGRGRRSAEPCRCGGCGGAGPRACGPAHRRLAAALHSPAPGRQRR